jgi:hypothetical protein
VSKSGAKCHIIIHDNTTPAAAKPRLELEAATSARPPAKDSPHRPFISVIQGRPAGLIQTTHSGNVSLFAELLTNAIRRLSSAQP